METDGASLSTVTADKTGALSTNAPNTSGGSLNLGAGNSGGEHVAKTIKTGKQYACTQCSYSADKKVSLNRHMRMHQTSPAHSSSAPPSNGAAALDEGGSSQVSQLLDKSQNTLDFVKSALKFHFFFYMFQQTDRYCSDCDIRFNNVKTYRAHKLHYCSSRRNEGYENCQTLRLKIHI